MLIAIEGGEATGKATQTKLLAERLGATRFDFPNAATATGKLIYALLRGEIECGSTDVVPVNPWHREEFSAWCAYVREQAPPLVLQSLMTMNRYEAVPLLEAARARGPVVLDRYYLSGVVYGSVEGLPEGWLWTVHERLPQPDVWILLDTPVSLSFDRRPERRDNNERNRPKLEAVRTKYLEVFERESRMHPHKWHVIDATADIETVYMRIAACISVAAETRLRALGDR